MPSRARTRLLIGLILVGAFALYLAGNGAASLFDRDEPRYAQCSREMIQGSPEHPGPDWVVPRHMGKIRYAKPVFIYWCQAAAMKLTGHDDSFAARLPSSVAMPITLCIVALGVWRWAGPKRAIWTAFVLATCIMAILSAKVCLTDSVLLIFVTLAQGCLYLAWRGRAGWGTWILMGIATGLAGLVKGPVVLGVMGMTLVGLLGLRLLDAWLAKRRAKFGPPPAQSLESAANSGDALPYESAKRPREWTIGRWEPTDDVARAQTSAGKTVLGALIALALLLAVVLPWLILVQHREPSFLGTSLSHDVVNRVTSGLEGHSGPPGYHLATIWGTYLPWSILLPLTIILAFKRRHIPQIRFSLAAVLGPWLMFEAVQTKLPHYMLPVFPFLAFLTADAIVRCLRGQQDDLIKTPFVVAAGFWAAILGVFAFGPAALSHWFGEPLGMPLALGFTGLAYAGGVALLFLRRKTAHGLFAMGVGMAVVIALLWTVYLPNSSPMRLSIRVAEVLKNEGATHAGEVIMLDYKEPTLTFYQGGTIRENSATALSDALVDTAPRWLVITKEVWNSPKTSLTARDRLDVVAELEGLAYADTGRRVTVMVVRKKL